MPSFVGQSIMLRGGTPIAIPAAKKVIRSVSPIRFIHDNSLKAFLSSVNDGHGIECHLKLETRFTSSICSHMRLIKVIANMITLDISRCFPGLFDREDFLRHKPNSFSRLITTKISIQRDVHISLNLSDLIVSCNSVPNPPSPNTPNNVAPLMQHSNLYAV